MSACSVWIERDRAHIISDAADYSMVDGRLLAIRSKVFDLTGSASAVAYRGVTGPWVAELVDKLAAFSSMAELEADLSRIARETHAAINRKYANAWREDVQFELTIASFAEDGPRAISLHTDPGIDPDCIWAGYEPFVPAELPSLWVRPGIGSLDAIFDGPVATSEDFYAANVEIAARRILEAQRFLKLGHGAGTPAIHGVGGFGELVSVSRAGVERRILCTWPDIIGLPIAPRFESNNPCIVGEAAPAVAWRKLSWEGAVTAA